MEDIKKRSEDIVICAILKEPSYIHHIMSLVSKDMITMPENSVIFKHISELYMENEPINLISVYQGVSKSDLITKKIVLSYVSSVYSMFPSISRDELDTAITFLVSESVRVDHVKLGSDIVSMANSDAYHPKEVIVKIQDHIVSNKYKSIINKKDLSNKELLDELDKKMFEAAGSGGINGIKTGYDRFDFITSGMQPTNFIIVAARPAVGKSQWALGVLRAASIKGNKRGLFISCEMDEVQVMKRIISVDSGIPGSEIKFGKLSQANVIRYEKSKRRIAEANFKIAAGSFTISDILSLVYKMKNSEGLDYVIIDYIQKVTSPGAQNRTNEVGDVSRKLKDMANDLKIPVIALAQLSRAIEHRTDKKPVLSDLRESGDIEQDADIVAFLYRQSYYMAPEEKEANPMSEDGYMIIAKHRDGELEDIYLKFKSEIPAWVNPKGEAYDDVYTQTSIQPNNNFDYQGSQPF
jgi:replicative DNA helicase